MKSTKAEMENEQIVLICFINPVRQEKKCISNWKIKPRKQKEFSIRDPGGNLLTVGQSINNN